MKKDTIITNPINLHVKSRETTWEEIEQLDLINRLKEATMTAWAPGHGLAAIQIGIPLRFAWIKWGEEEILLMNPKIIKTGGKYKEQVEGCLSLPRTKANVKRHYKIWYISDGKEYKAKGLKAQIIQHEIDHMNGLLITDER